MEGDVDVLIAKCFQYLKRGYPLPLDYTLELLKSDISPGTLEEYVAEGYTFDECLDLLVYYQEDYLNGKDVEPIYKTVAEEFEANGYQIEETN